MFTLALVGRPNVGKSSLFNRLVGKKLAIVHEKPGVTRDFREAQAYYGDMQYMVIDTPGLADPHTEAVYPELAKAMQQQSEAAIIKADMVAFVLDGIAGITPFDAHIAKFLFKQNKPVIVLINKSDSKKTQLNEYDVYGLGFDTVIKISAEHNLGVDALYQAIYPMLDKDELVEELDKNYPLKLAIMGRPNVGKSTLINTLIGEERLLTADMPGVTRDSVSLQWEYNDQLFELTDTAGIRKKAKVLDAVESMAVVSANKTLQFASVVVLVIDSTIPIDEQLEKQDMTLAQQIVEEGRGLVIALNKVDKINNLDALMEHVRNQLNYQLSQVRDVPMVPIAAINGKNLAKLMDAVLSVYKLWNKRMPTAKLNDWLSFMLEKHPTPAVSGRRIRIKYMTQIKTRPPTFALFCTQAAELPDSYLRYLANGLRDDFNIPGVPIRMIVKSIKNPYLDKA
jgi:GTP-binding protein